MVGRAALTPTMVCVMDLGILTIPTLVFLGYFGFSVATGTHEIMFEQIVAPASVTERGYSSFVVTQRIADDYRAINKNARTAKHLRDFGLRSDPTVVGALGDYFQFGAVVMAARYDLGLIEFEVSGDVVDEGETWDLHIRVERTGGAVEGVSVSGPSASPRRCSRRPRRRPCASPTPTFSRPTTTNCR